MDAFLQLPSIVVGITCEVPATDFGSLPYSASHLASRKLTTASLSEYQSLHSAYEETAQGCTAAKWRAGFEASLCALSPDTRLGEVSSALQ